MYEIKHVKYEDINHMRIDYYKNLTAPMDDMWEEGIIPQCDFYVVKSKKTNGYFALDDDNIITAFYVEDNIIANSVLDYIMELKNINKAYVSSYDPIFYNLCLRRKKEISINTLLYQQDKKVIMPAPFDNIIIKKAMETDCEKVIEFYTEKIGDSGDWLKPYLTKLIKKGGLTLFIYNYEIIGTGEARQSISNTNYINIGMAVSKHYRQKGLASYIVSTIRELYNNKGYITICSTTIDNIGSQKTLTRCGYKCYHKIFNVTF